MYLQRCPTCRRQSHDLPTAWLSESRPRWVPVACVVGSPAPATPAASAAPWIALAPPRSLVVY